MVLIGTNYHYDCGLPFNEIPEFKASDDDRAEFAERSPDPAHVLDEILAKALQVWRTEPTMTKRDLNSINCPVLVLTGDDEPFSNHHTVDLYEALPNGRLAVIPGASHYAIKDQTEIATILIRNFYAHPEFPQTREPNLRAKPVTERS